MIINSVNCKYNSQYEPAGINFKQGLTRDIVNHVKNMPPDEYQRIVHRLWRKYGMFANVGCSNTVAFCVEQTADIMNRAGFILPKYFKFQQISNKFYGKYDISDSVVINSNESSFLDLAKQNKMAEQMNSYNSSKHFLDTYLHEFSHAAHLNHIVKMTDNNKGCDIFFDDLLSYESYKYLQKPLISFVTHLFPTMTKKEIKALFPEEEKMFQTNDLAEYFAEKNAKTLETQLGQDFNIENVSKYTALNYNGFPVDWNINDVAKKITKMPLIRRIFNGDSDPLRDERIKDMLTYIIHYFEGEIWNGNVDNINSKCKKFMNYSSIKGS